MAPRTLKKHDSTAESRALKARRTRTTTQIRKDKRRETIDTKRRRVNPIDSQTSIPLSGRSISELVQILQHTTTSNTSHQERYTVLKEIRALISTHERDYEIMEQVIESGIVPVLVDLLQQASPLSTATRIGGDLYTEILWCLTNISSGQYQHTKLVLPAVPRLLQCLQEGTPLVAEHAAYVLGNIAADCEEFRQELIRHGAIHPLIQQLSLNTSSELRKQSAWALSNLARGFETPAQPFLQAGILQICLDKMNPQAPTPFCEETMIEIAWLFSFLAAKDDANLVEWLKLGLVDHILPYITTSTWNEALVTPLLRVCGNLCSGTIGIEQVAHLHRLVDPICPFLSTLRTFLLPPAVTDHVHVASESAWVISNLATVDATVVDCLLGAKVLHPLVNLLRSPSYPFELRREVAFAVCNLALTSTTHLEMVLEMETLVPFLNLLQATDVAVVGNSLRFVENVLRMISNGVGIVERNGGIEALEKVQEQAAASDHHLSQWAEALVNEFYGEEYGIMSPPMVGDVGGMLASDRMELSGGRGRGVHMTLPAWKK